MHTDGSRHHTHPCPSRFAALTRVAILLLTSVGVAAAQSPVPLPGRVAVQEALITPDTAGPGSTGHIRAKLHMRRVDVVPAIIEDRLRVRVWDGAGFDVTIRPSGCRMMRSTVTCRDRPNGLALRLRLRTIGGTEAWELRIAKNRLDEAQTSTVRPRTPVHVIVEGLATDAVAVRLPTCSANGARSLKCGASRSPNVIVIVTDDQRWDSLGFMPAVQQRLAGHGMRFDNAFVSTPVCCPSRATILTGLWAHNHGTLTLSPPLGGATKFVGADTSTMATWLQGAGYRTGFFGKYLNAYNAMGPPARPTWYIPPGWDRWRAMRAEDYFDFEVVTETGLVQVFSGPDYYSTDVLRDQAIAFMDEAIAAGQPFLVHYTPFGPHAAFQGLFPKPAPRHVGLFTGLPLPIPPNFDEEDVSDKPLWVQAKPVNDPVAYAISTIGYQAAAETLQSIDEAVAAMLDHLEAVGAADDTVIMFTSDNGYTFGEHRIHITKLCGYEECIRVPLVVRAPGYAAPGTASAQLVQNIDIAPTVAALAGVVPPNLLDGRSFLPLLLGNEAGWRTDLLFEQWRVFDSRQFVAVRTKTWKFIEDRDSHEQELYDLVGDPYELDNRATDPGYAALRDTLRARAFALSTASPGEH
jgi:N-acetylglucosamine-6-sulfatase